MLKRFFVFILPVLSVPISIASCSSNTVVTPAQASDAATADEELPEVEIAETGPGGEEDGGACTLGELNTGVKKCDDCLLKNCCVVINNCFKDKPCESMNACFTNCRSEFGLGDAGASCTRECAKKDSKAAEKLLDMLQCQTDRCGTECKG